MILRYFVEEWCFSSSLLFESAVFLRLSKLSYIKSVSNHTRSNYRMQRHVASVTLALFKTERIPSNPHVQKEPHFLHEWGKADFIDRHKVGVLRARRL